MEFRKLDINKRPTIPQVLNGIQLGETVIISSDRSRNSIKAAMARLQKTSGKIFTSTTKTGQLTVTRIK